MLTYPDLRSSSNYSADDSTFGSRFHVVVVGKTCDDAKFFALKVLQCPKAIIVVTTDPIDYGMSRLRGLDKTIIILSGPVADMPEPLRAALQLTNPIQVSWIHEYKPFSFVTYVSPFPPTMRLTDERNKWIQLLS